MLSHTLVFDQRLCPLKPTTMTTQSIASRRRDYLTVLLRFALGLSFLLAVADRLGILGPPGTPGVSWGSFSKFLAYNAQVNSFAPPAIRNSLGVAATVFESIFGLGLVLGIATRAAAIGSGLLLAAYGAAMALSFGIKSPFDYSVFSAMAGALMLAAWERYPLSIDSLCRRAVRCGRQVSHHKYQPGSQQGPGWQDGKADGKDECSTDAQTGWARIIGL